ncbi:jg25183 [Pararge aegeria aegeria]|uniref:Jg25183 protein n=1 Tax=Pararge aegeria aegeria TaxID=348720 RepID=A0A8S4RX57_9NEOP|nr:jg25183 [Pararge aegeria aegeria]
MMGEDSRKQREVLLAEDDEIDAFIIIIIISSHQYRPNTGHGSPPTMRWLQVAVPHAGPVQISGHHTTMRTLWRTLSDIDLLLMFSFTVEAIM